MKAIKFKKIVTPVAYYNPSLIRKVYDRVRHPLGTLNLIKEYGFWSVFRVTFYKNYLLPPNLKAWTVATGFPMKSFKETKVEVI